MGTQKQRGQALVDMAKRSVEMALEDGSTREFVSEAIDLPELATATYRVGQRSVVVTFEDGSSWAISFVVGPCAPTAKTMMLTPRFDVIESRRIGTRIAAVTGDAYSRRTRTYSAKVWREIAVWLAATGYSEAQVEWILRSKYMRWASDSFSVPAMRLEHWTNYHARTRVEIAASLQKEEVA